MSERADDMADVLGGSSGLLVRQVKQIGSGESSRIVEEYKLDTELLAEFREHEKQMAIELGQWEEVAQTGSVSYTQVILLPKITDPEEDSGPVVNALPANQVERW